MSKRTTIICDLCGKEIKNPAVDGYGLRIDATQYLNPDPLNRTENIVKLDAHDSCVRAIMSARYQHIMGKNTGKRTNLEWLCDNPEKLATMLECPRNTCQYGGITKEADVCLPCLLGWLREEHIE